MTGGCEVRTEKCLELPHVIVRTQPAAVGERDRRASLGMDMRNQRERGEEGRTE